MDLEGTETDKDELHFFYDALSRPAFVEYNDARYCYVNNIQGDVVGIIDNAGNLVVEYAYNVWGELISDTDNMEGALAELNPFRYRGYILDNDVKLYYLRSRYYDYNLARFINRDDVAVVIACVDSLANKNLYAYCDNNGIVRKDERGNIWETIFDIVSLGVSIVEVALDPTDPWAWAGMIGDAIDLIPFVTGVGEATRGVKVSSKLVENSSDVIQSTRAMRRSTAMPNSIRSPHGAYEILFDNGYNYVGQGSLYRATVSAKNHLSVEFPSGITLVSKPVSIKWVSAPNKETAFMMEFILQNSGRKTWSYAMQKKMDPLGLLTYNKIASPGKGYYDWFQTTR